MVGRENKLVEPVSAEPLGRPLRAEAHLVQNGRA